MLKLFLLYKHAKSISSSQCASYRRLSTGGGTDGKDSLHLVQKLGGHSLGAVSIAALHNTATDVCIRLLHPSVQILVAQK